MRDRTTQRSRRRCRAPGTSCSQRRAAESRRVPLVVGATDGESYPALSLAAFLLQFGRQPTGALQTGGGSLSLIGRTVPVESDAAMRINYIGGRRSFTHLLFQQVLEGKFDPALVKDKVVFVGVDAVGVDRHSAPLLGNAPGVEIQANALDTLLRARFLRTSGTWVGVLAGLMLAAVAGFAAVRWRIGFAALFFIVAAAGYALLSAFMFTQGRIIDVVDPPSALAVTMAVGLVYRVMSERAAKQETIELFGRHVSKEVAEELVRRADNSELELGGEVREVTVLFADIRGFTTLSGGMDPARLVRLLNDQFEVVVSSVTRHGGIVNKFVGDAVMAFWNAPQSQQDHAYEACRAALEALDQLEHVASEGPPMRFGFGINTGIALAGNVGSAGRFEYTIMGETVNSASRLSGAADGGEVWIGERTCELLQGRIEVDALPPQQLKGMIAPIAVHRLRRATDRAREKELSVPGGVST